MKKLIAMIVLSLGLSGVAMADEKTYTIKEVLTAFAEIPGKLGNHISNEVEKTKLYQQESWAKSKAQWNRLKAKFIKQ